MTKTSEENERVARAAILGVLAGVFVGGAAVVLANSAAQARRQREASEIKDWALGQATTELEDVGYVQLVLPADAHAPVHEAFTAVVQSLTARPDLLHIAEHGPDGRLVGYRFYTAANQSRYLTDRLELHFLRGDVDVQQAG